MQNKINLQDNFLTRDRLVKLHVTVVIINAPQHRRMVTRYDPFVVVLMTDNKQQVIYKHAISTIVPERALELEAAVD